MRSFLILNYIWIFVWYFPLFRQKGTKYFNYFLISALATPIGFVSFFFFKLITNYTAPAIYLFLLASLFEKRLFYIIGSLGIASAFIIILVKPSIEFLFAFVTLIDFFIFLVLLLRNADRFLKKQEINLFLLLLFLYHCFELFKMFQSSVNALQNVTYYYFGLVAELLLGIAFWFININTKTYRLGSNSSVKE